MDRAELSTEQVLKRDIPWETYMTTKLISGTGLQLLRRYDNRAESVRAQLLDDDGPAYVQVFVNILRDIFKEETVEYVLALIDEMLTANPKRARLFHDKSLANEDTYEPFLSCDLSSKVLVTMWLLWKGNWFIQEKSCKILALIVSARPKTQDGVVANGENSKKKGTTINDVLKELVEWLCTQLKKPSHPTCGIPTAINCLASLLKEPVVRSSFVQADGVKLLIPLITPASTQQSIQLLYETCLCVWLLSYYEPAIEYLATSRALPRLVDVVRSSTKEKVSSSNVPIIQVLPCNVDVTGIKCMHEQASFNVVVRVVVLTFRNLLSKGTFGAQMVDLGLPQIVQSLKAQAWSDEDLLEALNHLEDGLKDNIKKLSSFDKYKQEVLLGHLDWSPMHKDPLFWRDNVSCFEENDFQVLRVLITIMETSSDPRALAVACFDLSQFIQHHPAGRVIVNDLKAKERVMKLMNHDSAEVTKNALLCIQRLFLGAKYASFLQA
ncbi:V-type proton ATPase subunit H -like protein [Gossypium arboreum]|uniref:V-type proton ATPase subunit H n=1 Tax=Gossypium arboreum TaxID=29729 RepID=A0A0B0PCK2_GOSAR|nr:V-type proton ATPase subunit H -like protein [Gossypium arboreum]